MRRHSLGVTCRNYGFDDWAFGFQEKGFMNANAITYMASPVHSSSFCSREFINIVPLLSFGRVTYTNSTDLHQEYTSQVSRNNHDVQRKAAKP